MSADEHQSFIKTPRQLITIIGLSFIVPILLIVFLTQMVTGGMRVSSSNAELAPDAVKARIRPVASVRLAGSEGPRVLATGEQVYKSTCLACHAAGLLNAPKVGDTAAWAKLIKEGLAALTRDAIKGVRQMPPKGGNPDLQDVEVQRAIVFMANQSGASWKEPADDAAAAATPPAADAAARAPAGQAGGRAAR